MRRTLIIAAGVVVILGILAFAYFYFFAGGTTVITTTPGAPGGLPVVGNGNQPTNGDVTGTPTGSPAVPVVVSARLVKISAGPVVLGEIVTNKKSATASSSPTTLVSYIERQSGNVYSYSNVSKAITRTSNKTLPGIQTASWLPSGAVAFVRYLSGADFSTINTHALPSGESLPAQAGGGFFLPRNLAGIAVSSTSVLTLASGVNGSTVSNVRTDGTHSSEIFTTPLSSIRVSFAGKNQYLVYTKPSTTLSGDAFIVDGTGHFSRIAGPLTGLVALASPLGKWVLVSYTANGAMQMDLVSTATGEFISLPVATIADKCAWMNNDSALYCGVPISPPAGGYPDDWYQGVTHFSDRIWKIDTAGRYAQLVLDFNKETNGVLDAEALVIDPLGTTLVFVNKNDGSLWIYQL